MIKKLLFLTVLFAGIVLIGISNKAHAQAFRGIVIDKIAFSYDSVPAGTQVSGSFKVIHDFQEKDKVVTLYLRSLDFTSDGVSGVPLFIEPSQLPSSRRLSSWISFEKSSFTLTEYGQEEIVNFTINVPSDADTGGKYAAILVGENPPDESDLQGVALSKELGPLVFLTVQGEITKSIISDDLYTLDINGKRTSVFVFPPVTIVSRLKNTGNVHLVPRGVIYVYKGGNFQDYEAKFDVNEDNGYILAESTRVFAFDWTGGFIETTKEKNEYNIEKVSTKINWDKLSDIRIGKYNVKLLYSFEDINGTMQTSEAETSFWVIPWPIILVLLVVLGIISFIVLFVAKRVLRKKKGKNQESPLTPSPSPL